MESMNNETVEINVKDILTVLLHKLWIVIIATIVGAAIFGAYNQYYVMPLYVSTTQIYVIHRQDDSKTTISDLQTGTQLTKDYMILVTSRPVLEKVIQDLQLDMTTSELEDLVFVVNPDGTRILEISVVHFDPSLAKQIADAIAEASAEQMVNIMEMKKVNIIESGNVPIYPSSPNVRKNTILGAVLGLVISVTIIVMVRLMNDHIRTAEDIEKYLGITMLGVIPKEKEERRSTKKRIKSKKKKKGVVEGGAYATN